MVSIALAVAIALLAQSGPAVQLPSIERHRIGPVELGADAQKIYEALPRDRRDLVDLGYEGMLSPALLLRFPGTSQHDGVVVELLAGPGGLTVWRIEIRDPVFRTRKGIGVGSSVGQLRAAYRLDSVLTGEGNVVIRAEELSASFVLEQRGAAVGLQSVRMPDAVPDSVRIRSVLLTR